MAAVVMTHAAGSGMPISAWEKRTVYIPVCTLGGMEYSSYYTDAESENGERNPADSYHCLAHCSTGLCSCSCHLERNDLEEIKMATLLSQTIKMNA